jgi:hypothetical protein
MGRATFAKRSWVGISRRALFAATVAASLTSSAGVRAQQRDDAGEADKTAQRTADPARFLPGVLEAETGTALVAGGGWAGYDSATHAPLIGGMAEARITSWLVLGAGALYAPGNDLQSAAVRPSAMVRAQLLDQRRHGIDGGVAFAYHQDRFVGEDGFFQGALTAGRHSEAGLLLVNLAYGTDGEGDDHEGELRVVGMARLRRGLNLGLDGRLRRSLDSTDPRRAAHGTPSMEFTAGPAASYVAGPLSLTLEAGVSGAQLMRFQAGAFALGGVGAVF